MAVRTAMASAVIVIETASRCHIFFHRGSSSVEKS